MSSPRGPRSTPLVTVLCTAHDAARTIQATIESTIAQTLEDWELIVVDDGSTDGTADLVERHARIDPRIVLIQRGRVGRARALNLGLERALGAYVAILDADDVHHPQRLELQAATLAGSPAYALLSCDKIYFFDDHVPEWPTRSFVPPLPAPQDVTLSLAVRNVLGHSQVMASRETLIAVGGYNERIRRQFDYDLWIRCCGQGYHAGFLPLVLVARRLHAGQHFEHSRRASYVLSSVRLQCKAIRALPVPPSYYLLPPLRLLHGLLPVRVRLAWQRWSWGGRNARQ